jgi:hypothetical protein
VSFCIKGSCPTVHPGSCNEPPAPWTAMALKRIASHCTRQRHLALHLESGRSPWQFILLMVLRFQPAWLSAKVTPGLGSGI